MYSRINKNIQGGSTRKNSIKEGDEVMMISKYEHSLSPDCCPPVGTIGQVLEKDGAHLFLIQWAFGSTTEDDVWWIEKACIVKSNKGKRINKRKNYNGSKAKQLRKDNTTSY